MKKPLAVTTATFADLVDLIRHNQIQHGPQRSIPVCLRFAAEQRRAVACGETAGESRPELQSCGAATLFARCITSLLRSFAEFCAAILGLAPKATIRSCSAAKRAVCAPHAKASQLPYDADRVSRPNRAIVGTASPQFILQPGVAENAENTGEPNSGVADSRIQMVVSESPKIDGKCHVLVELKLERFSHENLGQLNTYVGWYRAHMMTEGDNPPVGILLCTDKNHALAEYALAGMDNQLFVAKYQLERPKKEEMQRFIDEQLVEIEATE